MTTAASDPQIVPESPPSSPALRAGDGAAVATLRLVSSAITKAHD